MEVVRVVLTTIQDIDQRVLVLEERHKGQRKRETGKGLFMGAWVYGGMRVWAFLRYSSWKREEICVFSLSVTYNTCLDGHESGGI